MKTFIMITVACMFICSCSDNASSKKTTTYSNNNRLAKASREDKNGWIYLHLEGSPADIGYQHGYLIATEMILLCR
jgi:hypothetical protein